MTNEPSKHAVSAGQALKGVWVSASQELVAQVIQSAIDAATAQLKILLEESESDFQREQRERIAAEQQVLVLREALDYYAKDAHTPLGPDKTIDDVEDGEIARKALSTSAEIASGWVPIEDVKPLLDALNFIASWSEGDEVTGKFDEPGSAQHARTALHKFLAKHGDKFK